MNWCVKSLWIIEVIIYDSYYSLSITFRVYILKIGVTQDGSITILASPTKAEASVFREAEDDGTVLCRVESAVIKEAVDTVRRWNARHNTARMKDFGRSKGTRLRSLFDEIGALPRPNWSFVEISPGEPTWYIMILSICIKQESNDFSIAFEVLKVLRCRCR